MQARSAVQCRSARLSEAVSPAKSARVAIGLIVVKSVAKSLLILIRSGDIVPTFSFLIETHSLPTLFRCYRAQLYLLCRSSHSLHSSFLLLPSVCRPFILI